MVTPLYIYIYIYEALFLSIDIVFAFHYFLSVPRTSLPPSNNLWVTSSPIPLSALIVTPTNLIFSTSLLFYSPSPQPVLLLGLANRYFYSNINFPLHSSAPFSHSFTIYWRSTLFGFSRRRYRPHAIIFFSFSSLSFSPPSCLFI